jgi:hypothetical protein
MMENNKEVNVSGFDKLYPDAETWDMRNYKGLALMKEKWTYECICGNKTKWCEFDFEEPLCSEECAKKFIRTKMYVLMTLKQVKKLIFSMKNIDPAIKATIANEINRQNGKIILKIFRANLKQKKEV